MAGWSECSHARVVVLSQPNVISMDRLASIRAPVRDCGRSIAAASYHTVFGTSLCTGPGAYVG